MATQFFPVNAAPVTDLVLTTATGAAVAGTRKGLSLTRGATAASQSDATQALSSGAIIGPWAQTTFGATAPWSGLLFLSEPLSAVTLAATPTLPFWNVRALETGAKANYGVGGTLWRVSSDGVIHNSSTAGVDPNYQGSNQTTELGTTEAARTVTPIGVSQGPFTLADTDRLLVTLTWVAVGGNSATGFTAQGFYSGPTAAASGDTYLQVQETVTLFTGGGGATEDRFPFAGGGYYGFREYAERAARRFFRPGWERRPSGVLVPA